MLLTNCGTLGKPLNLFELQYSYLWDENNKRLPDKIAVKACRNSKVRIWYTNIWVLRRFDEGYGTLARRVEVGEN